MIKPSIYWIPDITPNRLAIMPRPKGGEWLVEEIAGWKAEAIKCVISLLEAHEIRELELKSEAEYCQLVGIELLSFPIPDRGIPTSMQALTPIWAHAYLLLAQGKTVAIHCRAGIGRSGLVAACLLHLLNVPSDKIFPLLSKARGVTVPDTDEQIAWVQQQLHQLKPVTH